MRDFFFPHCPAIPLMMINKNTVFLLLLFLNAFFSIYLSFQILSPSIQKKETIPDSFFKDSNNISHKPSCQAGGDSSSNEIQELKQTIHRLQKEARKNENKNFEICSDSSSVNGINESSILVSHAPSNLNGNYFRKVIAVGGEGGIQPKS